MREVERPVSQSDREETTKTIEPVWETNGN